MTVKEEKAEIKKKLIRVEGLPDVTKAPYGYGSIHFGFISSPAQGRKQVTKLVTCREYLNDSVRQALKKQERGAHYTHRKDRAFDPTKMRLLIVCDPSNEDVWKTKLFSGKACLNLLEDVGGWEKSTITTVKHSVYDNAWLVTGPAEWVSQPQLLSLATWVLRLATKRGPLKHNNYDEFEANILNISKNPDGSNDAGSFAEAFWNRMYVAVKCHKAIFSEMPLDVAWAYSKSINCFGAKSGFQNFCSDIGTVTYSEEAGQAQNRFHEYCKEFLPRKVGK